jgi:uncharacterized protein (DUF2132 family)
VIEIVERLENAENPLEIHALVQELHEHRDWERLDRWCYHTYGRRMKYYDQTDWDRWTLIAQIRIAHRCNFEPWGPK